MSIDSINKLTNRRIVKIARELGIENTQLGVLIDLYYDDLTPIQKAALIELHELGFKLAINNARAEYVNILSEVNFDYAFYNNGALSQVDEIFVELVQSLGTIVILNEKGDYKYRYVASSEPNFRRAYGEIASKEEKPGEEGSNEETPKEEN